MPEEKVDMPVKYKVINVILDAILIYFVLANILSLAIFFYYHQSTTLIAFQLIKILVLIGVLIVALYRKAFIYETILGYTFFYIFRYKVINKIVEGDNLDKLINQPQLIDWTPIVANVLIYTFIIYSAFNMLKFVDPQNRRLRFFSGKDKDGNNVNFKLTKFKKLY